MRRFDWTMGHARTQGRLLRVCGAPEHRSARRGPVRQPDDAPATDGSGAAAPRWGLLERWPARRH